MTRFVNVDYPTQHPGVARVESAIAAAQHVGRSFSGSRGLSTLLLSAMAAAVMVVAYQVMDTMAEGHMLVVWMALWAVAFTVLAVFASAARTLSVSIIGGLDKWSRAVADAKADERLWAIARTDARVMSELQSAMSRDNGELDGSRIPAASSVAAAAAASAANAAVIIQPRKSRTSAFRAYQRNYI